MPKISVIIPSYNHQKYLKLRIDSILEQTFQDFELIILDDCSRDDSKNTIEKYRHHPKVSGIYYNEENSGSTFKQWEKGMMLAKSEWLWIAESDDFATPGFLEELLSLTYTHDNIGIAFCNSYKIDQDQHKEELAEYMDCDFKPGVDEVKDRLCHYNTITNVSSCIIKKDVGLKAIAGLGKYKACGDWIFYTRVLQMSNLAYTPKRLNYYRWHPANISFTACQNDTYITEGINVMKYIDFNKVRFSTREFLSLSKGWFRKLVKIHFRNSFKPIFIMMFASFKFGLSRMHIDSSLIDEMFAWRQK